MNIESLLYSLPAIIVGFTVHEYFHAYAAYKLGDSTAKNSGRLKLDPLRHIDPIGMIFIIIAGFGWAKPVSFNPDNLSHPKRDRVIIALAGPFSNLIMGIASLYLLKGFFYISPYALANLPNNFAQALYKTLVLLLLRFGSINLGLFIFNMLPIPPLDGSHVFLSWLNLSSKTQYDFMQIGQLFLLGIIIMERALGMTILPIGLFINKIVNFIL